MNAMQLQSNPFALLLAPEAVIAQIANSKHLAMLNSRVCRPLDKPFLGQDGEIDGDGGPELAGSPSGQ